MITGMFHNGERHMVSEMGSTQFAGAINAGIGINKEKIMITAYRLVTGSDMSNLTNQINKAISQGFEPQGGIAINTTGNNTLFVQAVVSNKPQGVRK